MTYKKKSLVILLLPIAIYGTYTNAGAISSAGKLLYEAGGQAGLKLFGGFKSFMTDIDKGFVDSKRSWSSHSSTLKQEAVASAVGVSETATQNKLGDEVKERIKSVQYIFNKEGDQQIQTIAKETSLAKESEAAIAATTLEAEKQASKRLNHKKTFPVTIHTEPADATVRIMNIGPKYQPGMMLTNGQYDIEITKDGYRTQRMWIDFTPLFNTLKVKLNKKGTLACKDFTITEGGSTLSPYGSQIQITDYLENVTVSEVYLSLLEHIASRNYIDYYQAGISGDYAYFNYIYGFLDRTELSENQRVVVKSDRFNQAFIGIEQVTGEEKVKLITQVESPQYSVSYAIEEAYCAQVKAI